MLCRRPFVKGVVPFACGQCMHCRISLRRLWTHRMLLEARLHSFSSFVTLTYADEFLPPGGTLVPRDTVLWLKRLRKEFGKLRYFLCGEYGDETFRPHYHAILFGFPATSPEVITSTWGLGMTSCYPANREMMQYVSGYVTKKMTKSDDQRLQGRHPEFARMSRRPGLGAGVMPALATEMSTPGGLYFYRDSGDVPAVLSHGRQLLPLGRYLRSKLREEMGMEETGAAPGPYEQRIAELSALRNAAGSDAIYRAEKPFVDHARQARVEAKAALFPKVKKL